jgi:NADH dehydrogenase
VLLGTVTGADRARKHVLMGARNIAYDVPVLATGGEDGYFGNGNWVAYASDLQAVDETTEIRGRVLLAFERERLLTTVVGGGPIGVEIAGAVVELVGTIAYMGLRYVVINFGGPLIAGRFEAKAVERHKGGDFAR